jgi:hypothetical protein
MAKNRRFRGETVQIRRVDLRISAARERVRPLLIRQQENQIRFARKAGWLRHPVILGRFGQNGERRNRTSGPWIFSPLLWHPSGANRH